MKCEIFLGHCDEVEKRVNAFLANSRVVVKTIKQSYYGREPTLVISIWYEKAPPASKILKEAGNHWVEDAIK